MSLPLTGELISVGHCLPAPSTFMSEAQNFGRLGLRGAFPLCWGSVLFRAQSLHQDPPDIVEHDVEFWVSPLLGVRWVMEPGGCKQDRLTRGNGIDVAKGTFFNS